jgi:predicted peroxiredoxin
MHQAKTLVLPVVIMLLAGCQQQMRGSSTNAQPRDGVFVHISRGVEYPHAVLMGLKMANLIAEDRDVLVYFDLKGVDVVLKDAPDLTLAPFDSSHKQIRDLLAKNVPLYVCPSCLKASAKTESDIMKGVTTAEKEAFFSFTEGRILSIDY